MQNFVHLRITCLMIIPILSIKYSTISELPEFICTNEPSFHLPSWGIKKSEKGVSVIIDSIENFYKTEKLSNLLCNNRFHVLHVSFCKLKGKRDNVHKRNPALSQIFFRTKVLRFYVTNILIRSILRIHSTV